MLSWTMRCNRGRCSLGGTAVCKKLYTCILSNMARSEKTCEYCFNLFTPSHSRVKFCSPVCAKQHRATSYKPTEEQRLKISNSLKKRYETHGANAKGEKHSLAVGKGTRGSSGKVPNSIMDCSARTVRKILKRLNIGCSRCGWKEGVCDLHHIEGRKIPNANNHDNLTYICPNCHRLFHEKKIGKEDVITLSRQIGELWKELYFG